MIKIYAAETEVSLFIYLLYILVLEILVCTSTVAVNVKMRSEKLMCLTSVGLLLFFPSLLTSLEVIY